MSGLSSSSWERWLPIITALVVAATPFWTMRSSADQARASINKDYVSLAISVLGNRDSSPEMKQWAAALLNNMAPVPMPKTVEHQLSQGAMNNGANPNCVGAQNLPAQPHLQGALPEDARAASVILAAEAMQLQAWGKSLRLIAAACADNPAEQNEDVSAVTPAAPNSPAGG